MPLTFATSLFSALMIKVVVAPIRVIPCCYLSICDRYAKRDRVPDKNTNVNQHAHAC
jgi:hypothetical protein